jgi:hypothetical protein
VSCIKGPDAVGKREDAGDGAEGECDSGVEDSQGDSREGEGVGETHGFGVHDGEAEEQKAEDRHPDALDGETETQIAEQKQSGGCQFDGGVAPGDALAAVAAASAEKNPAEDGDVVEGADGRGAVRAAGARADDGFVTGQAGDADVEEAAEGEAEEDDEGCDEQDQRLGSATNLLELCSTRS